MSSFNFTDFVIYSNITNADSVSFSTIAHGVIGLVKSAYGIFLESGESFIKNVYLTATATSTVIRLEQSPITAITSIMYNGSSLPYSLVGQELTIDTTLVTDITLPVIVTMVVGYSNVPDDLKFAIYRHIEAVYFDIENSVDNVEKSINSAGNTVFYRGSTIPAFSKMVYDLYSQRQLILY